MIRPPDRHLLKLLKLMSQSIKSKITTNYQLACQFGLCCLASGLVIGSSIYILNKPEVGLIRSRRAKYGQYNETDHTKPSQLQAIFTSQEMLTVYKHDPALSALHSEIYEGENFRS